MEKTVTYFDKPGGDENTDKTLALARARAEELGIKTVIVATTEGKNGVKAVSVFKGFKVIVVTHVEGFLGPNTQEITPENRKVIVAGKGIIFTAAHAFGGLQRALATNMPAPPSQAIGDIIAMALRTFGQGMKVACEIATMAADAGLVRVDEDVVSIGGTGKGADTAIVIQPNYTHRFFQTRVKEIICKPRM